MIRSTLNLTLALMALSIVIRATAQDLPLTVADLQRTDPVDFATEIMPVLKRNCLACHHEKEAEGGLVLESVESIHDGGDSGSGVSIDDPVSSVLLARATGVEEPLMPPDDNAVGAKSLTPEELGLLKLWIEQGAKGSAAMNESIQWQEIPESVRTSLALAVSPDDQVAAVARGNRVVVVDLATQAPSGYLVDPDVLGGNAAHVDLVQSIAVSPDARRIATGGFRTVKIWSKESLGIDSRATPLVGSGGLIAVKPDESVAALVNAIGDIELWDLEHSQRINTLSGHRDRISGLAWAASADRLVSCDLSGRVVVWLPSTGGKACEIDTSAVLVDLAISDDGNQLATIDITAHLHRMAVSPDASDIELMSQGLDQVSHANSVLFASNPDPVLIVSDQSEGVIVVSCSDEKIIRKIDHGAVVDSLALSADQTRLLTGGRDGKTRVWNLSTGDPVLNLEGDPQAALQLAHSQREAQRQRSAVERVNNQTAELDKRLASENELLTKATEEQQKAAASLEESEKKRVDAAAVVAGTEQIILKANEDSKIANGVIEAAKEKLAASNAEIGSIQSDLEVNATELNSAKSQVEKVKTQLAEIEKAFEQASARASQIQKIVDEKNAALAVKKDALAAAQNEIESATKLSADSKAMAEKAAAELEQQKKTLATAEEEKKKSEAELAKRQQALDTAAQAQKRAEAAIPAHKEVVQAETRLQALLDQRLAESETRLGDAGHQVLGIATSRHHNLVATTHRDGSVRCYRLDDGKPVARFDSDVNSLPDDTPLVTWVGHTAVAYGIVSPPKLCSTQFQWVLERSIGAIDDASTISDRVTAIDFRQDGLSIAVGSGPPSRSGEVKVFAVETGQLVRDFGAIHSDTVLGLAFSPRGRFIASSAADKTIRLLDVATGEVTRSLEGHTHHVLSIAWQDDGQSIASASADRTVKLWDAQTGEQRKTISGFGKEITAITFVSASNQLATACADGQVRLYDASNGKSIRTFNANGDFLFSLGVSHDGKTLFASGQSGVLWIWNVADAKLLKELK